MFCRKSELATHGMWRCAVVFCTIWSYTLRTYSIQFKADISTFHQKPNCQCAMFCAVQYFDNRSVLFCKLLFDRLCYSTFHGLSREKKCFVLCFVVLFCLALLSCGPSSPCSIHELFSYAVSNAVLSCFVLCRSVVSFFVFLLFPSRCQKMNGAVMFSAEI